MDEFGAELKARRFVQEAGITKAPVDLSLYSDLVSGKVSLDDLDPDESGYTMATAKGPLITLNSLDRATRRRFTLCHEIAHVVLALPADHSYGPEWSYSKRPNNEICCDVFAAELLLPYKLFVGATHGRPIDFGTVDQLRFDFFASRETTSSRLAATSKIACAYVLSEGGRVRHLVRSPSMRGARGWIERGSPLPVASSAYALRAGLDDPGSRMNSGDVWFDEWTDVELIESSVFIKEYDQTLTLLHCTDQEELDAISRPSSREQADDDDALLKPLDGNLQWPAKRRRR